MDEWPLRTYAQSLAGAARERPDGLAVVCGDGRLTYAELWADARLMAANLKRLGVRRGDHVAIWMGNSVDWVVALHAAATLGAVTVPVNTRFKSIELEYCVKQADVRLLLVEDTFLRIDFIDLIRQVAPAIDTKLPDPALPLLDTVVVFGSNVPKGAVPASELRRPAAVLPDESSEGVDPDQPVLMQFTSGTTSFPKGVMLSHHNMLRDAFHVGKRLGITAADRYFSARPLNHVAGTTLSVLTALEARAAYLTMPTFDAEKALELMESEGCTFTCGNDTMFLMMMNHPSFPQRKLKLHGGWAAASEAVLWQIHDRMGMRDLCSAFGMSECSPNAAMSYRTDDPRKRLAGLAHPLPGVEVRIVDPETGQEKPRNTIGEIRVRGWNVMKGYYKMPEKTAEAVDAEGWLHTGDSGIMDEDGRIAFQGRIRDCFRVGGENVAPAEVEDILHRHPAIKQAQVIGVPDARLLEVAAAYIILNEGFSPTPEEIMAWTKERCANFKVPRYVRFVETFDNIGMTASSKIQKNKLLEYALDDLGLRAVKKAG